MAELFERRPPDLMEQLREVQREIGLRARVYPEFVRAGKLTQKRADQQIGAMMAVAETLGRVVQQEHAAHAAASAAHSAAGSDVA